MANESAGVHVVFGAGPVGRAVADELVARGRQVRVISRSGRPSDAPSEGSIEWAVADASDPEATIAAAEGASVVYFALNPPYHRWPELFPPLQANVLAAAKQAGARLVAIENVYMYGPTGGTPMVETAPAAATTKKGRVRAAMHEQLMAAHAAGDVAVAVGRASDFVGPRVLESGLGSRAVGPLVAGKRAQVLGDPDLPHTYTYMPDIGVALANLGERDEAVGEVWHIPSGGTVTTRAYLQLLADAAGVGGVRVQHVSKLMLRLVGLFNAAARESVEMVYQFEEPFILDHSKYTGVFGDHSTPLPDAAAATVEWYREQAG